MTIKQAIETIHALGWGAMARGDSAGAAAYWEAELLMRDAMEGSS